MFYRKICFAICILNTTIWHKIPQNGAALPKPMVNESLFEGDMKGITHENADALIKISNNVYMIAASPKADNSQEDVAVADPFAVWPNKQLFYEITNDFNDAEKKIIRDSLEEYHQKTCIKMIPRTDQKDYVTVKKISGCWSLVGRQGGMQELSLGKSCVDNGIVIHEFMHALGFFHEQNRWDRDSFVEIHKENIIPGQEKNFNKYDQTKLKDLNTDYDYQSVMHYKKNAFSKNGLDTITALKSNIIFGLELGLSEIDVLKIHRMYNCDDTGPEPSKPVQPLTPGIIQSGSRLFGHYTQYNVKDAEECRTKCIEQFECAGMTFDTQHTYSFGNCFLTKVGFTVKDDNTWSAWLKDNHTTESSKPINPLAQGIIQSGSRLFGHYTQYNVKDAEECRSKCTEQIECAGMTFDTQHTYSFGNCFLAKTGFTVKDDKTWSAWTKDSRVLVPPKPVSPLTPGIIQAGSRLYGHYTQYNVKDAEECRIKCIEQIECAGMTFDTQHTYSFGNCFLAKAGFTVKDDQTWSAWTKKDIEIDSVKPGLRLYGHYTQYFVQVTEECKKKCEADSKCYGMTFDSSHSQTVGNCFLVHSKYEIKPDTPWSSWMKGSIKHEIKFTVQPYSGLRKVKTIETCIQTCQKDPRCQAMNFFDGYYDSDVYGNCFLYEAHNDYGRASEAGKTYTKFSAYVKGKT